MGDVIPPVSYITMLDKYTLLVYVTTLLVAVQSAVSYLIFTYIGPDTTFDMWSFIGFAAFFLGSSLWLLRASKRKRLKKLKEVSKGKAEAASIEADKNEALSTDPHKEIEDVVKHLRGSKTLTWCSVHGLPLKEEGIKQLAAELRVTKHQLKHLDLSRLLLKDPNFGTIMQAVGGHESGMFRRCLTHLYLDSDGLQVKSAQLIVDIFGNKKSALKLLSLRNNFLRDDGIAVLCKGMVAGDNSALEDLYVTNCDFKAAGAKSLAEALASSTVLKVLNISYNDIAEEGAKALLEALKGPNKTLEIIQIFTCGIGELWENKLDRAVKGRRKGIADAADEDEKEGKE